MSDLISRQAAIDALCSVCNALGGGHNCDKTKFVYNAPFDEQVILCPEHYALTMLPTIQPERKTGRWIPDNTDYYRTRFICSVCGESEEVPTMGFGYAPMWGYCPNCGADMRGEKNG